jgi:hypothetical protein
MKTQTVFRFEDGDVPSPGYVEESFNLLAEFCPEIREQPKSKAAKLRIERTAFNSICANKEFTREHLAVLSCYGHVVARAAEDRYRTEPFCKAAWATSILVNARRLRETMNQLRELCGRSL